MAIYRLEADVIRRSRGRSSTASAAYRAAAKIEDARSGLVFDYTRKRGVLHSEILAPADTPDWMHDRAQLWNAVEQVEKRKDAQLAREILVALPHELTPAQRIDLVRDFVSAEFVTQGMIADISIHAPHRSGDDRNYHAHILLTMRALTGAGFGNKVRDWNDTDQLEQWRRRWQDAQNSHLERHGHAARVDCRSLEAQGIEREPEPKQGPVATQMEREGRPSLAGDDRRAVQDRNRERDALAATLAAVAAEIGELHRARTDEEPDAMNQPGQYDALREEERRAAMQREERQKAAQLTEEQRRQQDRAAVDQLARDNAERLQQQAAEMEAHQARRAEFLAEQQRLADQERKRRSEQQDVKAQEGAIRDAAGRYAEALGQHYDIRDPYGSLARAAMGEYGAFASERQKLAELIAIEKDPEMRRSLELRRDIEAADYMTITSHRIAAQSEVITGRRDSDEAVRFREKAAAFETQAKELRKEFRELHAERARREAEGKDRQLQRQGTPGKAAEPPRRSTAAEDSAALTRSARRSSEDGAGAEEKPRSKRDEIADKYGNVEITDEKAAKLDKLRETIERSEKDQQTRDTARSRDPGGRGSR